MKMILISLSLISGLQSFAFAGGGISVGPSIPDPSFTHCSSLNGVVEYMQTANENESGPASCVIELNYFFTQTHNGLKPVFEKQAAANCIKSNGQIRVVLASSEIDYCVIALERL